MQCNSQPRFWTMVTVEMADSPDEGIMTSPLSSTDAMKCGTE